MAEVNLPEGWAVTTLENVAVWGSGGTPSRKESAYYDGNVPWVKTGDLGPRVLYNSSEFISELAVQNSSAKYFPKGSVAIAMYGATIGKTSILGIDATTNQACGVGNPIEGITFSEFLYYFLLNEKDNFIAKGKGGAQPNISQALIKEHEIALPPLAEQKVIAEKLDTLLAQVDNTKARLERIPEILKRFRQSVLAAAVSGKLTEEWRNGKNLKQLPDFIEKYAIDDEYSFAVPIIWKLTAIGNCATFQQGLQIAKATRRTEPSNDVLPILRTVNYENGFSDDIHYALVDDKSIIAEPEDIIISRTGTVGRVLTGYRGVMHNNSFRINYDKRLLLREYLICFLKSPTCQEYVKENSGRSSQPDLTHKAFAKCPLALPSISEQTEIVRRVEELFVFADRIEQAAQAALSRVNNLTQSILAKAFRGELTADWRAANPELISGENSAEALLARIKAERDKVKPTKKAKAG